MLDYQTLTEATPMRDFALEQYFSRWEFSARFHLTASDIESMSINQLLEYASGDDREAFEQLWLGYTETCGSPALREQIAATYEHIEADDVLCFAGAEEGVYVAMRALLSAADHAIVVVPNYQAAETLPMEICRVTGVPLEVNNKGEWVLDVHRVAEQIRPNTRVISINFPNNPTGAVMPRQDFDALVSLCADKGIYLFSDEVYYLMERSMSLRLPQAADVHERGLSLNVMSKSYGLPGLRIGWIACRDRELLAKMERYKHYLSICNSAPSEQLAIIALKSRHKILARNRQLLTDNGAMLNEFFSEFEHLFEWYPPQGSCVAYPRYLGPGDTNTFCEQLVEKTGVLLLPPKVYHSQLLPTPQDRFRIGFGRRNLAESLAAFRNYLV